MCNNRIDIEIEIPDVPKPIESVMKEVLTNQSSDVKIYYPLLVKLEKLNYQQRTLELKEVCQTVMSSSLFTPPTVTPFSE